jgi:hypothetical protein
MPELPSRERNRGAAATVLILCVLIPCLPASIASAADTAEYKPPGDVYVMDAHFRWCGEATTAAAKARRYEKFWELQHPKEEDGYDDSPHIRAVRRCAYRLAQLYAELGRSKDCVKMLRWLEKEDDALKVGEG